MPGMLEREHGHERDGGEKIERKNFAHGEEQNRPTSTARPNTGDGFASGNRSVTMMSSRNGSVAESAGS